MGRVRFAFGEEIFCFSKFFTLFYDFYLIPRSFHVAIFTFCPNFLTRFFKIFNENIFELARGPINTGKIRIGEETSVFIRIGILQIGEP